MVMAKESKTPYEHITETILAALESGNVVWQKPWQTRTPANAITGKPYRGINPFLLMLAGNYTDHRWVTFKQAQELGGSVRKGEKGVWIVYSSPTVKKDKVTGDVVGSYWLMRSYVVFNVEQCDGLEKLQPLDELRNSDVDPNILAENIWARYQGAPEVKTGAYAAYIPSQDVIIMPPREDFDSNAHYYATLYHEGGHSTGHGSRLNRKSVVESDGFGGYVYALEELIAEFTAAFLIAEAGLEAPTRENTVAYIQNWMQVLKADPTMVVKAASAAQKAADWIMGVNTKHEEDTHEPAEERELAPA
jgi:antirestriction protein ArdC